MVPEITNSTLVAPTPDMSGQSGVIPIDDSRLRGVGLALFGEGNTELARDDEVVLVGFDGRSWAEASWPAGTRTIPTEASTST